MEITVKANRVKCSPKKMILVVDMVRKLKFLDAKAQLKYLNKEAAASIYKLLKSAASAAKDKDMNLDDCIIKSLRCDQGVALKRRRMLERGKASAIRKRTSNLTLTLSDNKDKSIKKKNSVIKSANKKDQNGSKS
ncbi:MAG: hypothetical protein ACD_58C00239G0010 [uncultured bacterium]|nr:MAG: hypothetical protein ACD_58C00239G0010 [uncultured bacterium]